MNYIEMSKLCEHCKDCKQCKDCKKLDKNRLGDDKMNNTYNMKDVYKEINNASVELEVDEKDLIIRIPYLAGDADDIIRILKLGDDKNE